MGSRLYSLTGGGGTPRRIKRDEKETCLKFPPGVHTHVRDQGLWKKVSTRTKGAFKTGGE